LMSYFSPMCNLTNSSFLESILARKQLGDSMKVLHIFLVSNCLG